VEFARIPFARTRKRGILANSTTGGINSLAGRLNVIELLNRVTQLSRQSTESFERSLRDARVSAIWNRGLKPTANHERSLRDVVINE
jgi:hypothetical protein